MPTRNISLTDHFDRFVEQQIKVGQYRNASEVMRDGLRLLEQRNREDKEKLQRLRSLVAEGLTQVGRGQDITFEDEIQLDRAIDRIDREAATIARQRRPRKK